MRKFRNVTFAMLAAMALCLNATLVSCNDDDDPSNGPGVKEVEGSYAGTMATLMISPGEIPSTEVTAAVKDGKIEFANFPVSNLVGVVLGGQVPPALGDYFTANPLSYNVPYAAVMNAELNGVELTLAPEPLTITLPAAVMGVEQTIKVTIEAAGRGNYVFASNVLTFNLRVSKIEVNGQAIPSLPTITLGFEITKKTK
ncbi:MAG: DUF4840 domain-containing protein [Prevotellaceae bacterium]|jgi:hypothetical protein|nr:DUF4840 domain-containing protein [Prevotellaceae bacterium]